jgi:hypothetical protein
MNDSHQFNRESPSRSVATEHRLQAILAEYAALRSEIEKRSELQHQLLAIHMTALTAIVGAAIAYPDIRYWLTLLIPFEAASFGLWYTDHGLQSRE